MTINPGKSGWLLLLLLLAIAGLTSWLRTRPDIATPAEDPATAIQQIDFFMENFRIHQYNERGQLHYILEGSRLKHYEQDDRAEIDDPDLELADDKHWSVQADHAVAEGAPETEEIRFLGNVRLEQADNMVIRTESLLFKPAAEYMESLEPVVISGPSGDIEASSLRADLRTDVHTLTRVKGRYVP